MKKKNVKNKSIKNKNSMKYIYEKCNHYKYSQLVNIKDKSEVASNCKNFFVNYKIIFSIVLILFMALMIYAFRSNPLAIVYCFAFIIALFLLAVYNCTYKLTLDEKSLCLTINFQKTIVKTDSLATIYISKEKMRLIGIPIYNYNINIIYLVDEIPYIISLPTVMASRKQIKKLFSNIETEKIENSKEELKEKDRDKNKKIATYTIIGIIIVTFITVTAISAIIYNTIH